MLRGGVRVQSGRSAVSIRMSVSSRDECSSVRIGRDVTAWLTKSACADTGTMQDAWVVGVLVGADIRTQLLQDLDVFEDVG